MAAGYNGYGAAECSGGSAMNVSTSFLLSTALTAAAVLPAAAQQAPDATVQAAFPFEKAVLAEGLGNPFEIRIGPDGWLWVTERTAAKVTRINLEDGSAETAYEFDA
ncbi:MAG TPA: hypothetical protein VEX11_16730, partial [Acetobacteraceae bacterium]|nr:hypothetical protein [Acetobacteraceae bacterium]